MLWRIPKGCRRCKARWAESLRQKDRGKHKFYFNMFSNMSPELLNFSAVFLFFKTGGKRKWMQY
jgi:hypothetical protein